MLVLLLCLITSQPRHYNGLPAYGRDVKSKTCVPLISENVVVQDFSPTMEVPSSLIVLTQLFWRGNWPVVDGLREVDLRRQNANRTRTEARIAEAVPITTVFMRIGIFELGFVGNS